MAPIECQPPPAASTSSDRVATASKSSRWRVRHWVWMSGLASIATFALGGVYGVPAAVSSPDYGSQQQGTAERASVGVSAVPTTTTTSTPVPAATTSTTVPTPTPVPTPAPAPAPAPAVVAAAPVPPALPAVGQATAWGCSAALAYLQAYAAPGFALDCPGYAEGHEAMTCIHGAPAYPDACLDGPEIAISDACPQAYMNEAANSWNLSGQLSTEQQKFGESYASIDPFGACP